MTYDPNRNGAESPLPDPDELIPFAQDSDDSLVPADSPDYQNARLQRVRDYRDQSLAKPNPLEANLGSLNSGLMQVAIRLEEIILAATAHVGSSVERLNPVLPALDAHLRVTRQVDRFTQLEQRANQARNRKNTSGSQSKHAEPMEIESNRIEPPKS